MSEHNAITGVSYAAQHCAEAVNKHISDLGDGAYGKWVAVRLEDGRSDGTLYDTKPDAYRHQRDETRCAYIEIQPGGMTLREAESYLMFTRQLYANGYRMIDPENQPTPMPDARRESWARQGLWTPQTPQTRSRMWTP